MMEQNARGPQDSELGEVTSEPQVVGTFGWISRFDCDAGSCVAGRQVENRFAQANRWKRIEIQVRPA
jgi:hypothetical protein